jgi:hypothetical protein
MDAESKERGRDYLAADNRTLRTAPCAPAPTYAVWLPRPQNERASTQKRLAFPLKESVYADVRGAKNDRRTPFAPSIASIRGSSW